MVVGHNNSVGFHGNKSLNVAGLPRHGEFGSENSRYRFRSFLMCAVMSVWRSWSFQAQDIVHINVWSSDSFAAPGQSFIHMLLVRVWNILIFCAWPFACFSAFLYIFFS